MPTPRDPLRARCCCRAEAPPSRVSSAPSCQGQLQRLRSTSRVRRVCTRFLSDTVVIFPGSTLGRAFEPAAPVSSVYLFIFWNPRLVLAKSLSSFRKPKMQNPGQRKRIFAKKHKVGGSTTRD